MFPPEMPTTGEQKSDETPVPKTGGSSGGVRRHRGRRGGRGRGGRAREVGRPADVAVTATVEGPQSIMPAEATDPGAAPVQPGRESGRAPIRAPISQAIAEVGQIIESLKQVLDQMEEVLELVELAERQQIGDEREIESLRRSLRQLQHPRSSGARPPDRPAQE